MPSLINDNELVTDLFPFIRVYKDGTIERPLESPRLPPSPSDPTTGVSSKDISVSPHISARLYLPPSTGGTPPSNDLPILVYFHGGGFVFESAFSILHHPNLNSIVSLSNCIAISVEFRSAPEYPLPAAYEDSWEALNWVTSHSLKSSTAGGHPPPPNADQWLTDYGNFEKLYLGGDSAGGNIVHNMAMRAGKEKLNGGVEILGGFLSHPYFVDGKNEEGSFASRLWTFVYPDADGGIKNPMINPWVGGGRELSELGCSRLMVVVSEKDELLRAGVKYCEKVRESGWGGDLELVQYEDEDHIFHMINPATNNARDLIQRLASFIV